MKSTLFLPWLATATLAYRKEGPACKLRTGIPGLCIAQSACRDLDGVFEAGFCPGQANDVKCCTWPICQVTNSTVNINGQCVPEGACGGGTFTKGLCKGPDNVMCCSGGGFGGNTTTTSTSRNSSTSTTSRASSTKSRTSSTATAGTTTTGAATPSNTTGPVPAAGARANSFDSSMALSALLGVIMVAVVL